MMIRRRHLVLAALAIPFGATARDRDPARLDAVRRAVVGHIVPGHTVFAAEAAAFASATAALADTPDRAGADLARARWTATAVAFQRIRHLRFGPMEAFDRGFRIALFPDPRNSIARDLTETLRNADPASITQTAFQTGRIPVQGLPAAERLLFGEQAERLLVPGEVFRRRLLAAIGLNLSTIATDLLRDWTMGDQPHARAMEGVSDKRFYRDPGEGMLALFKSLHGGIDFLADRQIARPLGPSLREARPRSAEAWRSGQSLTLARAALAGVTELHRTGFDPILRAATPRLAGTVLDGFAAADLAAGKISPGLEAAVADPAGRSAVEALLRALGEQRRLLTERVAPALGIPAGFNAMDGD